MDPKRFAEVKRLLLAARERSGAERARYLDDACGEDAELRAEVEGLLAADSEDRSLLQTAGAFRDASVVDGLEVPESIGPYTITGELGRGGMGVVLRAEQHEPIQRVVAIKLMGVQLLTDAMRTRFQSERQTLAALDHPSIAHVIDAGTDDTGRPYLVMELVDGRPIGEYCDAHRLSIDDRLALFLQVCDAVRHAHQRGILHRDLKSSNVMITTTSGEPRVKVIDFGIAKALGEGDAAVELTRAGQIIGTPDCMSPEQAGVIDAPVDTRTDVYALGILLYELLAGVRPYHFESGRPMEFMRLLERDGPPAPSALATGRSVAVGSDSTTDATQVATHVAELRRATVAELSRRLSGDLDAIALQALRAQPEERYSSVDRLADDIQRYREGLPVLARSGGFRYRAQKFVRRHVASVVVGALVAIGAVAFVVALAQQRDRALQAQQQASDEAEAARRVSDFLVELFEVADPSEARGNTVTAREILDRGVDRITDELQEDPEVRARLLDAMGRVYQSLGLYPDAARLLREAVTLREEELESKPAELATSYINYAFVLLDEGEFARAESLYSAAIDIRRRILGEEHAEYAAALAGLAAVHIQTGNVDAAEPLLEEALAIDRRTLGPAHPYVALDLNDLASIRSQRDDYAGAAEYYRQALEINRRAYGELHPETATNYANLGVSYALMGKVDSAIVFDRKGLELREELLGREHAHTGISMNNLAGHLQAADRPDEALPLAEEALEIKRRAHGADHRSTAHALVGLARVLIDLGEHDRAKKALDEALAIHMATVGPGHTGTHSVLVTLARLERERGNAPEAVRWAREALRAREEHTPDNHIRIAQARLLLARALELDDARDEALSEARTALAALREYAPEDSTHIASAEAVIARLRGS